MQGNGNGSNVGKGGETVFVTLTFNKAVTLNAGQHAIGLNVGPDPGVHAFSPILDSLGVSAATFTFTGTLPTNAGIDSNDLRLTKHPIERGCQHRLQPVQQRLSRGHFGTHCRHQQPPGPEPGCQQRAVRRVTPPPLVPWVATSRWKPGFMPTARNRRAPPSLNLGSAGSNTISLTMDSIGRLGFEAFNGASSLGKAITTSTQPLALYTWNQSGGYGQRHQRANPVCKRPAGALQPEWRNGGQQRHPVSHHS